MSTDIGSDDRVLDLLVLDGDSEKAGAEVVKAIDTMYAIESLSVHFIKGDDVSDASLESYRVAVDAVLLASGLPVPAELFCPSFEAKEPGKESVQKKANVFKRILDWLRNWLKSVSHSIKLYFNTLGKKFEGVGSSMDEIDARLARLDDKDMASTTISDNVPAWAEGESGKLPGLLSKAHTNLTEIMGIQEDLADQLTRPTLPVFKGEKDQVVEAFFKPLAGKEYLYQYKADHEGHFKLAEGNRMVNVHKQAPMYVTSMKLCAGVIRQICDAANKSVDAIEKSLSESIKVIDREVEAAAKAWDKVQADVASGKYATNEEGWAHWDAGMKRLDETAHMRNMADCHRELSSSVRFAGTLALTFAKQARVILMHNLACYKVKPKS